NHSRFDLDFSSVIAWAQPSLTALQKLAAPTDPPDPAACGNVVSPIFTPTFEIARPSVSAAVCAMIVYEPVPISLAPSSTLAFTSLSALRVNLTAAEVPDCRAG